MITRRIQSNSGSKKERTQWQQTNNEKHGMKEDERAQWRLKQGKACHERRRIGKRPRRQKKKCKKQSGAQVEVQAPFSWSYRSTIKRN